MLQRLITEAAKKRMEKDLSSNYKKDSNGNPISSMSTFFRVCSYLMLPLGISVLGFCVFTPGYYVLEGIDPENIPVFMYGISFFLIIFSLRMMCYKATLEKDALVIRCFLRKRRIPLDELRLGAMSVPPIKVRCGCIAFSTSTGKKVRVMYMYALGGVAFIQVICRRINAPFPQGFNNLRQNASFSFPKE
jgi:hypothetical protein